MQIFGLLALLVTVFGGIYMMWFSSGAPLAPATGESTMSTYNEAISEAKEIADNAALGTKVEVYAGISFGIRTTVLDLSGRGLTGSLKAEVRQLTELTTLNLSGNNFTGLPSEVGQLSKLKVLNLANNPLTGLPYELGNLQNLQVLDLRGTMYAKEDLEVIKAKLPKTTTILVD